MNAIDGQTALVTGGSGYLACWTIVELLQKGYRVRTTVRDLGREPDVRAMIARRLDPGDRLSFAQADLLDDKGWARATEGVDYVVHVASPMPVGENRGTDLVGPAVDGTLRVLSAAKDVGVQRVVLTSSANAAMPADPTVVADETVWSNVPTGRGFDYQRAKTLAERAAWDFAKSNPGLSLTTVLPGFVQGPVLGEDYSGSVRMVAILLGGKLPAVPRVGWSVVDVRDVADLHVRAMESPDAAGQRFMAAGDFAWAEDFATILRDGLGDAASKVPTRRMPNALVRVAALVNPEMRELVPRLGVERRVTSAKARRVLGWTPRPAADAILDAGRSLVEHALV